MKFQRRENVVRQNTDLTNVGGRHFDTEVVNQFSFGTEMLKFTTVLC